MATLQDSVERQVLILDGAMGTMIQQYELSEQDFRGEHFRKLNEEIGRASCRERV